MFPAAAMPGLFFRSPLELETEARLAMLGPGERRIVYFFDPELSSFRYRAVNMAQSLAAAPELAVSASWFTPADFGRMDAFVDRADTLVLCRAAYDGVVDRIIDRAKRRGIPVLFDVDDLVFDTSDVRSVLEMLEHNVDDPATWNYWCASFGRLGATLKACDGAIVPTAFLAERIEAFAPGLKAAVIPNFLNRAQQSVSRRIFAKKKQSGFAGDGRVHVGYFSGTPSHKRDFEVAADVLARLMKSDRRLILRIVGPLAVGTSLSEFQDRIERYPLQDFINLQHLIGEVEINVAPLIDNVFTQCKSDLKFFEAAIVGTITVASPIKSFRAAIQDNRNGFLAAPDEWECKINAVLAMFERGADYQDMADVAFQFAEERYGWDKFGARISAAIFGG
jgi:glycosyltransferase involved in cell wall biosynthesis